MEAVSPLGFDVDGMWFHLDERPAEPAVLHAPTATCPAEGRHPRSDCGYMGGILQHRLVHIVK